MTGTQICETPEFRAGVDHASSVAGKGLPRVDLEEFLGTFR
jgi:hypothetical protein